MTFAVSHRLLGALPCLLLACSDPPPGAAPLDTDPHDETDSTGAAESSSSGEEPACDAELRCDGDRLVHCIDGTVTTEACPPQSECRTTLDTGAACIPTDAEPCDPETFDAICVDDQRLQTCADSGWTQVETCPETTACFEDQVAACFTADAQPCTIAENPATCTDGIARTCTTFGVQVEDTCEASEACLIDETCIFGCAVTALCVSRDAAPCDEPQDTFCADDALYYCIDGFAVFAVECPCEDGPEGAQCQL